MNHNNTNIITNLKYILKENQKKKIQHILEKQDVNRIKTENILKYVINEDVGNLIFEFIENKDERLIRLIDEKCKNFTDIMNMLHTNNIEYSIDNKY